MSDCCKSGFRWEGKPTGTETKLADRDAYVVGTNKDAAVLIIHDIFGWTLNNTRLLADHYASEAGVTVYVPDLYVVAPFIPFSSVPEHPQPQGGEVSCTSP